MPVLSASSRFAPYVDQGLALIAALVGGFVLSFTPIPAPWLTGAMLGAAFVGAWRPVADVGPTFRDFAFLLTGLSLGCSVRPETLRAFADYPVSLAILFCAVVFTVILSAYALMRFFGWTRADAIFASAPGALSTVMILASSEGADIRRIIVVQLTRLFAIIACLPSLMMASGLSLNRPLGPIVPILTIGETVAIFAIGFVASIAARWLRFPSPWFMGPMIAAALLTGSGLITDRFPPALAVMGFVMIGAYLGVRFHGLKRQDLFNLFPAAIVSLIVTIATAFTFAFAAHWLAHIPTAEALIAFAPGGLEAMAILAFALHLDPVYIGAHHLARFLGIGLGLPLLIRLWPSLFGLNRASIDVQAR